MAPGRKTGGRKKGSKNKPKPKAVPADKMIILEPTDENRMLVAMAPTAEVRTPKAVMLAAMLKFEKISDALMAKAERMTAGRGDIGKIAKLVDEAHRFTLAAVDCANKAAPYIHARILAIEARGDMTDDKAPFVIRAPAVMADSAAWQAAVGAASVAAMADQDGSGASAVPAGASLPHPALPQPKTVEPEPMPAPVVLRADQKTGGISTAMPPGPKTIKPAGSQEWLDTVEATRKAG